MITSAERSRLEVAYTAPVDAVAALSRCAAGLLVVLTVAIAAAVGVVPEDGALAAVSVRSASSDR